ncbi:3-oxoacyl-ACP reductase [Endozoicomonas sp. OPT23]|uniref:SDR family NAD(P)-dependent oxidoreductase n=1 Tax=Endozoicomonas sp. OPT23 TaxID=2072845 RepID=UPI00129B735D|nr:SDR family NAD(P)-dependent oxidoreductase [Endozoicomonas sp. OPT23]MRI33894.1 3-oxoacyl-ACP reductase [Endozoicomonas sp. OPT23]
MKEFSGKVAVITGGASGIGFGLAKKAVAEGMKVVIADIEQQALNTAAADLTELGGDVLAVKADVSDSDSVQALADKTLEHFGAVHVLFNNAGVGGGGCIWEMDKKDWEWVLGVNLWGVINGVSAFTKHMVAQNEGHVVNTASIAGLMSAPGTGTYTVSKHAVVALSESLYGELQNAEANVGVSVLCPAFVNTKIFAYERNRPEDKTVEQTEEEKAIAKATEEASAEFFAQTLSPESVAETAFNAIRNDEFYILTHPIGSKEQVEKRMRTIIDGGNPSVAGPQDFPHA